MSEFVGRVRIKNLSELIDCIWINAEDSKVECLTSDVNERVTRLEILLVEWIDGAIFEY